MIKIGVFTGKENMNMKMLLKDGKLKVLTLSYDDCVIQDIRLMEIMDKYGLKGTFNINSGMYLTEDAVRGSFPEHMHWMERRLKLSEAINLYSNSGHEIAIHSLNHPRLEKLAADEVIYQITEDRKNLESQYGVIVKGMAYPFGTYNDEVIDILKKCQILYARTVNATYSFNFPDNWLELHPTCHHNYEDLDRLIKNFVEIPNKHGYAEMFYLWGHSYELDNNWNMIERFAEYAGGHEHIWYATNIEIYRYVKAYESLETSYDKKIVYNPSDMEVWFESFGSAYSIKPGETVYINN